MGKARTISSSRGAVTAVAAPSGGLLARLAAEYPEVSWPVVAHALEQAHVAASALRPGTRATNHECHIEMLARDRLDVARERAVLAARRVGRDRPVARAAGALARHKV